jgi:hypothetical protein
MRPVVEAITIGGDLIGFLGASSSDKPFSAPAVSASMSSVLRVAKKLRAITVLVGSLRWQIIDFLAVHEVSSETNNKHAIMVSSGKQRYMQ